MAVTLKQIAEAAGVSRGTVDRALHGRKGVKPEVAQQVREIAQRMGYLPNRAGKMLAARKQPITIGYVLPSLGNPFFEDIKRGIQAAAVEMQDFGLHYRIEELRGFYPETHMRAIDALIGQGVSALCISCADTPGLRDCVNSVIAAGTPVVTLNTDLNGTRRLCYVGPDYHMAGRTAAGMLALQRNRRTLYILAATGSISVKGHNDRLCGFRQVLDAKAIPYKLPEVYETQDDDTIAYQQTRQMLAKHPETCCLFVAGAGMEGICAAVKQLPTHRRKNLQVICFDDTAPIRRHMRDGVVDFVVCQEPVQQGYQSVLKLYNYFLDGGKGSVDDYITKAVIKICENLDE